MFIEGNQTGRQQSSCAQKWNSQWQEICTEKYDKREEEKEEFTVLEPCNWQEALLRRGYRSILEEL